MLNNHNAATPSSQTRQEPAETQEAPPRRVGLLERVKRRRAEREQQAKFNASSNGKSRESGDPAVGNSNRRSRAGDSPPQGLDQTSSLMDGLPQDDASVTPQVAQAQSSPSDLFDDLSSSEPSPAPRMSRAKFDKGPKLTDTEEQEFLLARPYLVQQAGGGIPALIRPT